MRDSFEFSSCVQNRAGDTHANHLCENLEHRSHLRSWIVLNGFQGFRGLSHASSSSQKTVDQFEIEFVPGRGFLEVVRDRVDGCSHLVEAVEARAVMVNGVDF